MDAKRRLLQLSVLAIVATAGTACAGSGEHSFGEAFFVSRRNDGSIEALDGKRQRRGARVSRKGRGTIRGDIIADENGLQPERFFAAHDDVAGDARRFAQV